MCNFKSDNKREVFLDFLIYEFNITVGGEDSRMGTYRLKPASAFHLTGVSFLFQQCFSFPKSVFTYLRMYVRERLLRINDGH